MIVTPLERRRAEQFARAVAHGGSTSDPALEPLLRVVETLRPVSEGGPQPSPEFRDALRQRLLAVAAVQPAAGTAPAGARHARVSEAAPVPVRAWRRRLVAGLAGLAIGTGTLGGAAVAAQNALPGDLMYPLKRSLEDAQVTLAGSDASRGREYLEIASTRLSEAEALLRRSGSQPPDQRTVDTLAGTLRDLEEVTRRGSQRLTEAYRESGDAEVLQPLREFTRREGGRVQTLKGQLPPELRERSASLLGLLAGIDRQLARLPVTTPSTGGQPGTTAPDGSIPGHPGAGQQGVPGGNASPTDPSANTPNAGVNPTITGDPTSPTPGSSQSPDQGPVIQLPPFLPGSEPPLRLKLPPLLPLIKGGTH